MVGIPVILWLLVAGGGVYFAGRTVYKIRKDRHRSSRERLEDMLRKKVSYGRKEIEEALDAFREDVLADAGIDTTDWEGYFFAATAAVRELFDPIVEVDAYEAPDLELEAVQSGLKIYDNAHAGLLAHELRVWTRRLMASKKITPVEYDQRMIAADFTDPDMETEIK